MFDRLARTAKSLCIVPSCRTSRGTRHATHCARAGHRELLDELHRISPYDPDHLPREIELIEAFRQRHPKLPQVACFDTAFHRTMHVLPSCFLSRAAMMRRACNVTVSRFVLYLSDGRTRAPGRFAQRLVASSWLIWAMAQAWPPCATARVSIQHELPLRRQDW